MPPDDVCVMLDLIGVRLVLIPDLRLDVVLVPCCSLALVAQSVVDEGRLGEAVDQILSLAASEMAAVPTVGP